jgi:hypothetical protein
MKKTATVLFLEKTSVNLEQVLRRTQTILAGVHPTEPGSPEPSKREPTNVNTLQHSLVNTENTYKPLTEIVLFLSRQVWHSY